MRQTFFCRCLVDDCEAVVVYAGLRHRIENLVRKSGKHHLSKLKPALRGEEGLVVEEVVDEGPYELGVFAGVGCFDCFFVGTQNIVLCSLDFGSSESVASHPLHLCQDGAQCLFIFAVFEACAHLGHFAGLADVAYAQTCIEERCVSFAAQVFKSLCHNLIDYIFGKVGEEAHISAVELNRSGLGLPENFDAAVAPLRVREYSYQRFFVAWYHNHILRLWILRCRDVGKEALDFRLNAVHVNVADYDKRLKVRTVPGLVEIGEALRLERLEVLLASDERAARVFAVSVIIWEGLLVESPVCSPACSSLLDDDSSFIVDFHRVAGHEMRIVVHHEQAGVYDALAGGRHVVEHIGGHLHSC